MLSLANGEEISSVRPEAGALGLIQQTLKTVTMHDASKHLWISKNPVFTCLATLEKKKPRIFIEERFLYVHFNFGSFCCVLFKSNNQTPSSLKRNCCHDCAPLRPD